MEYKWHILIGFVASYILVYFFNLPIIAGLIIFISSWIIDGDHYLWYALEIREWNPIKIIKWYNKTIWGLYSLTDEEGREYKRGVFILHSIWFWIILAILSFVHQLFLWIFIGVIIHMVVDLIVLYNIEGSITDKIFPSVVMKKNKGKKGLAELNEKIGGEK